MLTSPEAMTRYQRARWPQSTIDAVDRSRIRVNGRWLLNFASASYLGFGRERRVQQAMARAVFVWGMSLGMPRSMATPRLTRHLERGIAHLVHQADALVFPSTTHVALDVLPLLAGREGRLFVDEWAYPISLDGAQAAARYGARIVRFPHDDALSLERALRSERGAGAAAVVCDGVYSAGGRPAALRALSSVAQAHNAMLYVDDAHGVGVLGARPAPDLPYGCGGGGTPLHQSALLPSIVHVGSFSKALSVPLAFVAGNASFVDRLRRQSAALVHCSPPALPITAAALAAWRVNEVAGDARRQQLADRVRQFRRDLAGIGVEFVANGDFPIQTLHLTQPHAAVAVAGELRRAGLWSLPNVRPHDNPQGSALRFIITAYHTSADIEEAAALIARRL